MSNYPCNCPPNDAPVTPTPNESNCNPCTVMVPPVICGPAELGQLRIAVQLLQEFACKINKVCIPQKVERIMIDSFSGNDLDISQYIPDHSDPSVSFDIIWNGQHIYATDATGVRDYTNNNGIIRFVENQENCRLSFEVCRCKTLLEMAVTDPCAQ